MNKFLKNIKNNGYMYFVVCFIVAASLVFIANLLIINRVSNIHLNTLLVNISMIIFIFGFVCAGYYFVNDWKEMKKWMK